MNSPNSVWTLVLLETQAALYAVRFNELERIAAGKKKFKRDILRMFDCKHRSPAVMMALAFSGLSERLHGRKKMHKKIPKHVTECLAENYLLKT